MDKSEVVQEVKGKYADLRKKFSESLKTFTRRDILEWKRKDEMDNFKLEDAKKWYASKINKQVDEFDEYDLYCATVAHEYLSEVGAPELVSVKDTLPDYRIKEIKEKLCYYDTRNPDNVAIYRMTEEKIKEEGYGEHRKNDCYCDNCFYGRTELAEELLKYVSSGA